MPHSIVFALLPYLATTAREARVAAGLTYAHIAVHVLKRNGRAGVSDSTVARFEYGRHWPENPDAMVAAYAAALGVEAHELWASAIAAQSDKGGDRPASRRRSVASAKA